MEIERIILDKLNKIPEEIVRIIYEYILPNVKCILNKKLFLQYHSDIKALIMKRNMYDNYLRYIIRNDYSFVFQYISKENASLWMKEKKYSYKNKIFHTYANFLEYLCIDNRSTNCRNILKTLCDNSGLSKNQHKKNIVKSINKEWSN
jgi:hypothetical protein